MRKYRWVQHDGQRLEVRFEQDGDCISVLEAHDQAGRLVHLTDHEKAMIEADLVDALDEEERG